MLLPLGQVADRTPVGQQCTQEWPLCGPKLCFALVEHVGDARHVVLLVGIDGRWLESINDSGREGLYGFATEMADIGQVALDFGCPQQTFSSRPFLEGCGAIRPKLLCVQIASHLSLDSLRWLASLLLGLLVVCESARSEHERVGVDKREKAGLTQHVHVAYGAFDLLGGGRKPGVTNEVGAAHEPQEQEG